MPNESFVHFDWVEEDEPDVGDTVDGGGIEDNNAAGGGIEDDVDA